MPRSNEARENERSSLAPRRFAPLGYKLKTRKRLQYQKQRDVQLFLYWNSNNYRAIPLASLAVFYSGIIDISRCSDLAAGRKFAQLRGKEREQAETEIKELAEKR